MAKKPGLPQGELELEVDEDAFGEPAHIDDYLDRTLAPRPVAAVARSAPQRAVEAAPPSAPVAPPPRPTRAPERREAPLPPAARAEPRSDKVVELERPRAARSEARRSAVAAARRAERRELSIDAETSRMIDRVVSDLQEQTPQKDVKASEFARAIIQLADESRHHQDFTHVNRRGQWGSPTARAFVADIKEGFLRAIGRRFIERHPKEALDYYREAHGDDEV